MWSHDTFESKAVPLTVDERAITVLATLRPNQIVGDVIGRIDCSTMVLSKAARQLLTLLVM
ncbi:hypothetical protein Plhal304r1_c003g0013061 [Plasmopara halstedii]